MNGEYFTAFFDDFKQIGVAWDNPNGTRSTVAIRIPHRKAEKIKAALTSPGAHVAVGAKNIEQLDVDRKPIEEKRIIVP